MLPYGSILHGFVAANVAPDATIKTLRPPSREPKPSPLAAPWRYPVDIKTANGTDLSQTPDNSCDLVHAHYVFTYLSVITTFGYFGEMCRVLKPGGFAFFDLFLDDQCTQGCLVLNGGAAVGG